MVPTKTLKFVGISGSLRRQSYNSALLRAAADLLPQQVTLEMADLTDVPFYNADVEVVGFPAAVEALRKQLASADALLMATPEYNFSLSGVLKNALEWLSRPPHPPLTGKPCAIMGASVSPLGTARGQFQLRHVCVSLNLLPINTPHVDVCDTKAKFDAQGRLQDKVSLDLIRQLLGELQKFTLTLGRKD